jgi:putative transposase
MERIKRRRDARAWGEVIERFVGSGLSVPGFCAREAISASSFYRWRSLVQAGVGQRKQPQEGVMIASAPASSATGFVELGTLTPSGGRIELKLDLGGGVLLQLVRG